MLPSAYIWECLTAQPCHTLWSKFLISSNLGWKMVSDNHRKTCIRMYIVVLLIIVKTTCISLKRPLKPCNSQKAIFLIVHLREGCGGEWTGKFLSEARARGHRGQRTKQTILSRTRDFQVSWPRKSFFCQRVSILLIFRGIRHVWWTCDSFMFSILLFSGKCYSLILFLPYHSLLGEFNNVFFNLQVIRPWEGTFGSNILDLEPVTGSDIGKLAGLMCRLWQTLLDPW